MNRTVIAGYVRTPFAFARKGPFHATRPDDLAAVALAELVRRSGIDPHLIEDVLTGAPIPRAPRATTSHVSHRCSPDCPFKSVPRRSIAFAAHRCMPSTWRPDR